MEAESAVAQAEVDTTACMVTECRAAGRARQCGLVGSFAVDVDHSPGPLAALVPSYRPIFDRLLAVCEGDQRIRAFWLSGSLAKGTADAGSDLDCILAVRDGDFDEFAASWREWLATVTPTLIARELPFAPGSTVDEFFRVEAIVPVMLNQRRDYLCAVNGVQSLQLMLYNVFVECNQPQPPMGIKQWSARLTPEQRRILTELPVAAPEHDSIAVGLRATGTAMRTAGRAAVTACGGTWPVDLDEGVQRFVAQDVPAR
jgi:hypothetical protein